MADKDVLNLGTSKTAGVQRHYTARLGDDTVENDNSDKVGAWAGSVTGSLMDTFYQSGSLATHLADEEPYGGVRYANVSRVITGVVISAETAGSSGVTRVDVQMQEVAGGAYNSIFSDIAFHSILSQSDGASTPQAAQTLESSSWAPGTLLKCLVEEAATGMEDMTVHVLWKPSGSYGV